jgi:hypothetical protein
VELAIDYVAVIVDSCKLSSKNIGLGSLIFSELGHMENGQMGTSFFTPSVYLGI